MNGQLVTQKSQPTNPHGDQAIRYLASALSIPALDNLLKYLHGVQPDREDYTKVAIHVFKDDVESGIAPGSQPGSRRTALEAAHRDFGKLVPRRLTEIFGADAVYTRRDASGDAISVSLSPPVISSNGTDTWDSHALHLIVLPLNDLKERVA